MKLSIYLVTTLLLLGMVAPVRADDASEAQLQYELGVELYKQHRFPEALERFIASNRLVPNANVVFNIAQTYQLMRRPVEAYNWYETYLVEFELDDAQRQRGSAARDALGQRVAVVEVRSSPAGAAIYVDRVDLGSVGTAPRKVAVSPGDHRIVVRLHGYHEASKDVDAAKGAVSTAELALEPIVGTLRVTTHPAGATVMLADQDAPLGRTPLEVTLPVGTRTLVFTKTGFITQERTVRLTEDEPTNVQLGLSREASTVAVLSVLGAPRGAAVRLDGREVGELPLTLDDLDPGPRHIEVDARGKQSWSAPLVLEAGSATRVKVHLVDEESGPWAGWRWTGYGGGGAVLLAGALVGVGARVERNRFFDDANPSRRQLDAVRRKSLVADVLLATGLAAVGVTLAFDLFRAPPAVSTGDIEIDR